MTSKKKKTYCGIVTALILIVLLIALLFALSGYMVVEL